MSGEACSWCGVEVPAGDGYRANGPDGAAVFCRLEHVVPWVIKGAAWEQDETAQAGSGDCAWCESAIGSEGVVLERRRGEQRIREALCSVEHMRAWAAAGGPYRP